MKMKEEEEETSDGDVSKFYDGTVVLITGGTGFLGKVLVEKLLRIFGVKKIYLLIRMKNNMNVEDRLEHFFNETIFDRLRSESPEMFKKVFAINTNFDCHDLDITDENKSSIYKETQIVFNIVASVKFNEKLRDAIEINVLGTKKILDLVMEMENLKSFVHISTLYSNCNLKYIGEKVYGQDLGYEKVLQMTRILDDVGLEKMQHCLVGEMPNTYTMTKKCSENLVSHRAHSLPAGIFRPPIVLSTYKEPVPGWTDNLYGPSGICAWTAKGLVHCIHGDAHKKANLVPADYCINAIIATAWDVHRRYEIRMNDHTEIPVYNYIYDTNNLTWGKYMQLSRKGFHEPLDKTLWCFSYGIVSSKIVFKIISYIVHTIPGMVFDGLAWITGNKRVYSKAYEKLDRVLQMMSFFGLREWKIQNDNVANLSNLLTKNDKIFLPFDLTTVNWTEYFHFYLSGIKKYFFKENCDKSHKKKLHYKRLVILHIILKTTFWTVIFGTSLRKLWKVLLQTLLYI